MNLFDSIKQFLLNNHFAEGTNDKGEITFSKTFELPKKQLMINGRRVDVPTETRDFVITHLGKGSMINAGEEEDELQGFNISNNDIWVDSLEDFKFWINHIFAS